MAHVEHKTQEANNHKLKTIRNKSKSISAAVNSVITTYNRAKQKTKSGG